MTTRQWLDQQTRRKRRRNKRKGKSATTTRDRKEEGIDDVQRSRTAMINREEEVEAQQEAESGSDDDYVPITDPKEVEQEVQRLMADYFLYLNNASSKREEEREEERRSWLCHLPEFRTRKKKARGTELKNQPTIKKKEEVVIGETELKNQPTIKKKEEVVIGEAELKNQPTVKKKEEVVIGEAELKNQPTINEQEEVVIGEAAAPPPLSQDTNVAAPKERSGLESYSEAEIKSDFMAVEAAVFRHNWNYVWARNFGSYEDITRIPPMIYTDKKLEPGYPPLYPMQTLQIFSVKIVETAKGLIWPLDVFGMVVARDGLDHNRNIIFHRTRDNCQSISTKNPYLELTGPSRAVVVMDPVHLEVMLQVKGSDQSKDKDISFLVVQYVGSSGLKSGVCKRVCPSKLSKVELTYGGIVRSVEATISVQVIGGSWPDGLRGEFTASTTSLDDMKIQLLAFGDGKLPVAADGMVKLSRCVVSVELKGGLRVSVKAVGDQAVKWGDSKVFKAQRASRCKADLEVGSCKMTVTIAWSLLNSWMVI